MKAVFLGSIGVVAETSELQRQAYNMAFSEHGLDWYWSVANYCEMLKKPGGLNRISSFSNGILSLDEVKAIHIKKEAFFSDYLRSGITPRPGVVDCIKKCKEKGIRIGFITSTSQNNVNNLLNAVKDCINVADFELITTKEDVVAEKPAGDIYKYALEKFRLKPTEVIAVEDTEINQSAALQEEIFCYLFAGEYATTQHNINAVRTMATVTRQLK